MPEAAIQVATSNGADFVYESDQHRGGEAGGSRARPGEPVREPLGRAERGHRIKDGVGYDSAALIAATQGAVGRDDVRHFLRWPLNIIPITLIVVLIERILLRPLRRRRALTAAVSA